MQRNKTNDGSARLQSLTVMTFITSVGDILDKDWHFFAQRPLTRLRQISKKGAASERFQKWPLYCPQGSGTLRQQLLLMHGIAWYCIVLHSIAWYCIVLHGIA